MNANARNREIFEATGLTITGLPEQYMNDHPRSIVATLHKVHACYSERPNESETFDIEFKYPEIKTGKRKAGTTELRGYLTIDLGSHPKNKSLLELIKFMSGHFVPLIFHGRQYDNQFYVSAFYPYGDDCLSKEAFFYFLSQIGIQYEFPSNFKMKGTAEDAEDYYKLKYKIFRDRYPREIQRYLDEHLEEREHRDSVRRFIMMDWRTPELDLPTTKEARRILDTAVYGMEEVKERLLEFLEGIRRSGSLAKNLLLIGPPGTGKTTIMQAIANMLRLPMSIVPMSACADLEAFVGFARTYSGAQEGLVTTALLSPVLEHLDGRRETVHQIAQVLFLNEIDKTDSDKGHHGSVQSAILRMADDNRSFFDVYHQAHIDLSNVVIVADANDASKIQDAVLDRFEVIEIPAYTDEEKKFIFCNYAFPKALKAKMVERSEVSVTKEAVSLIVSSSQTSGVRELKKIADRIVGNYLLHHSWRKSTIRYTSDMVTPFLPKEDIRSTLFINQPGSIQSVILSGDKACSVSIQCVVSCSKEWSFHLYGVSDPLMYQELEAAAICACDFLHSLGCDVKVQIYGMQNNTNAIGQLGFPVFISVLSAVNRRMMDGIFYGGTTLLGGLTSAACNNPDSILCLAERSGVKRIYTAAGFSERLTRNHDVKVNEFLDARTAATLLFGENRLSDAI